MNFLSLSVHARFLAAAGLVEVDGDLAWESEAATGFEGLANLFIGDLARSLFLQVLVHQRAVEAAGNAAGDAQNAQNCKDPDLGTIGASVRHREERFRPKNQGNR